MTKAVSCEDEDHEPCEDCYEPPEYGVGGYPVMHDSEALAFGSGPYTPAEQARNARLR